MFLLSFAPSNSFIAIFFFYIEMMAELYDIICPTLMDHRAHKTENTCFRIHIQVALWGWKKKRSKIERRRVVPYESGLSAPDGLNGCNRRRGGKRQQTFYYYFFFLSSRSHYAWMSFSFFFFTTVFDSHKDFSCYFRKTWLPYSEKSNDFCLNFLICPSYSPCLLFYPTIQIDRVIV